MRTTRTEYRDVAIDFSIADFQNGRVDAFRYVFDLYYDTIHLFAYNLVKSEGEARDISTETFIKVWKLHKNFESLSSIKSFLYITARNASLDYLRAMQRQRIAHQEIRYLEKEEDVENEMVAAEVFHELSRQIEELPPQCQKIFKLIYFKNLSTAEVAGQLNITNQNVLNQKARAIEILRFRLVKKALIPASLTLLVLGFLIY